MRSTLAAAGTFMMLNIEKSEAQTNTSDLMSIYVGISNTDINEAAFHFNTLHEVINSKYYLSTVMSAYVGEGGERKKEKSKVEIFCKTSKTNCQKKKLRLLNKAEDPASASP